MTKVLQILVIIMTLVIIIGGFFGYKYVQTIKDSLEPTEMSIEDIVLSTVEISEITTNLADNKFIKLQLKVQTNSEEVATELIQRDFQVKNIIIGELSSLTVKDLDGKDGKKRFIDTLKVEIDKILDEGHVVDIYFTSYVIS